MIAWVMVASTLLALRSGVKEPEGSGSPLDKVGMCKGGSNKASASSFDGLRRDYRVDYRSMRQGDLGGSALGESEETRKIKNGSCVHAVMYIPFVSPLEATSQSPPRWPRVVESPSDLNLGFDFDSNANSNSNSVDVMTYGSHGLTVWCWMVDGVEVCQGDVGESRCSEVCESLYIRMHDGRDDAPPPASAE